MATTTHTHSPPPPVQVQPRRFPPPCWSDDETVALIQVYRNKWYSLRRGNLRAPDWQEVADGVAERFVDRPAKTAIQCRHKMEKLRKRYRAEIQRIGNVLGSVPNGKRYFSSWVHFRLMDDLELGLDSSSNSNVNGKDDKDKDKDIYKDEDEDEDEDVEGEDEDGLVLYPKRFDLSNRKHVSDRRFRGSISAGNGVRIKIPNFGSGMDRNNDRLLDDLPPTMKNPNYGYLKEGEKGMKRKDGDGDVMNEMVMAIERLGEAFVRTEKMKMEMARELEAMRMKAEMKQTEMILETHRKLWDTLSERKEKKVKREV